MSAEPAYTRYAEAYPVHEDRPSFSIVRGHGKHAKRRGSSAVILMWAKVAVVMFCVLAVLGFARVSISTATISAALETQSLSSEISDIRSQTSSLEAIQGSLSNPTRLRATAILLGMVEPFQTTYLDMSQDSVALDSEGNLSLSGSIANAVANQDSVE